MLRNILHEEGFLQLLLSQACNLFSIQTLSKFLGYILVYGALAVKVPQILKIVVNRSVVGISYSSVIIETFMNALLIGYNLNRENPFSIYG